MSGPAGRLLFDLIRSTIAIPVRVPSCTTVTVELEAWEDVLVALVVGDGTYGLGDERARLVTVRATRVCSPASGR